MNMARAHVQLEEIKEASFYYTRLMENWKKSDKNIDGYEEAVNFLENNPFNGDLISYGELTNDDLTNFFKYQFTICGGPAYTE